MDIVTEERMQEINCDQYINWIFAYTPVNRRHKGNIYVKKLTKHDKENLIEWRQHAYEAEMAAYHIVFDGEPPYMYKRVIEKEQERVCYAIDSIESYATELDNLHNCKRTIDLWSMANLMGRIDYLHYLYSLKNINAALISLNTQQIQCKPSIAAIALAQFFKYKYQNEPAITRNNAAIFLNPHGYSTINKLIDYFESFKNDTGRLNHNTQSRTDTKQLKTQIGRYKQAVTLLAQFPVALTNAQRELSQLEQKI